MSDHYSVEQNGVSFAIDLESTTPTDPNVPNKVTAHIAGLNGNASAEGSHPTLASVSDIQLAHAVHAAAVARRLDDAERRMHQPLAPTPDK